MVIKAKNLKYLLHPSLVWGLVTYRIYQLFHPDHPWISPKAIQFCEKILKAPMVGFEWGSGRSTLWFGQRLKELTSIEQNEEWHKVVSQKIREQGWTHVQCRFVPVAEGSGRESAYVKSILDFPDQNFDFVVVDGHFRNDCVAAALAKVKVGGYLLIDNSNWLKLADWGVPNHWPIVHRSTNYVTETTVWQKVD